MEIPKNLKDEIWDYCRINNISNIDEFTLKLIKQGFTIEKFGSTPVATNVIEKVVEVPVEVIKEVFVTDNTSVNKEILELQTELKSVKEELQKEKIKNKKDIYGEE